MSRAGHSARAERALILVCAAASAYMNVSAADVASPGSVAAYAVAPVALAMVDRVGLLAWLVAELADVVGEYRVYHLVKGLPGVDGDRAECAQAGLISGQKAA